MSITNTAKPNASSLTNSTRVNIGETWATDMNQWQNENRTWDATVSIITNDTRNSSSITNITRPS